MSLATATAQEKHKDLQEGSRVYQVLPGCARPASLPAAVTKMLNYFNGERNLDQVCELAQIPVAKAQAVVRKLTQLGILRTLPTTTPLSEIAEDEPAFTPEEEAFFAKEVEPIDECDLPFETLSEKLELFFSDLILRLRGNPVLG